MNVRDFAERLVWTFVSAAIGVGLATLGASVGGAIDVSVLRGALITGGLAGAVAVANAVSQFARWRLSVLPSPGEGLPGLPVEG